MENYVKVRIGTIKSQKIPVKTGLRQGYFLLPILFNIALEIVGRKMNMGQEEGVLQGVLQTYSVTI